MQRVHPDQVKGPDGPGGSSSVKATTAGAGESAAGVGAAVPTRPPDDIPDRWTWRPVGPLSSREGNVAVWTGTEAIYWGGDRPGRPPEGAAYDRVTDRWSPLPDLPLEGRDCLPRGISAGSSVFAIHCGQAAVLDRALRAWETVTVPTLAVDAPLWTGDGVVQWLGPSGRSDDGTWIRPLP
jgi:hypothetical protein